MNPSAVSLMFLSLWAQSLGLQLQKASRGLVFRCSLSSVGSTVPLMFDTGDNSSSSPEAVRQIYEQLIDLGHLPQSHDSAEIQENHDHCVLSSSSDQVSFETISYSIGSSVFAISAISASYFDEFAAFGIQSYPRLGTEFLVRTTAPISNEKYGCNDKNHMTIPGEPGWMVNVQSLGVQSNSSQIQFPAGVKGKLASLSSQIGLPSSLWSAFVSSVDAPVHVDSEGRLILEKCDLLDPDNLPELTIDIEGFSSTIPMWGSSLLHDLGDGTCVFEVYESLDDFILLGAPFFKLGYVQLCEDAIDVCPSRVYPQATVDLSSSSESLQNGIWIGVTIGGFCLVVLVTVFLVMRSVRKKKQTQDCPRRSMIHDPSIEGSSVAGSTIFDV